MRVMLTLRGSSQAGLCSPRCFALSTGTADGAGRGGGYAVKCRPVCRVVARGLARSWVAVAGCGHRGCRVPGMTGHGGARLHWPRGGAVMACGQGGGGKRESAVGEVSNGREGSAGPSQAELVRRGAGRRGGARRPRPCAERRAGGSAVRCGAGGTCRRAEAESRVCWAGRSSERLSVTVGCRAGRAVSGLRRRRWAVAVGARRPDETGPAHAEPAGRRSAFVVVLH
jgi:hypothetical protein